MLKELNGHVQLRRDSVLVLGVSSPTDWDIAIDERGWRVCAGVLLLGSDLYSQGLSALSARQRFNANSVRWKFIRPWRYHMKNVGQERCGIQAPTIGGGSLSWIPITENVSSAELRGRRCCYCQESQNARRYRSMHTMSCLTVKR